MATYKVIQDIEADDKLVGPFGIRQFVYLLIVAVLGYIAFRAAELAWFLGIPFLPFIFFFALLALPFGGSQPTEVWLLAKFRFALKPKVHIWSQDGIKELVTITVPKKIEKHLTKELSQSEVRSRLETLASTIDSRGWSIKHVDANMFTQPALAGAGASADRLVDFGPTQGQSIAGDVNASDDVFDEQNNPTAQNLGRMVNASSKARRDQVVAQMKQAAKTNDTNPPPPKTPVNKTPQKGMVLPNPLAVTPLTGSQQKPAPSAPPPQAPTIPAPQPGLASFSGNVVTPDTTAVPKPLQTPNPTQQPPKQLTEEELLEKIHAEAAKPKNYGHLHVVKTLEQQQAEAAAKKAEEEKAKAAKAATQAKTPAPNPDIIELANNDDLNVETIARQVNKKKGKDQPPPGEVVIKLH